MRNEAQVDGPVSDTDKMYGRSPIGSVDEMIIHEGLSVWKQRTILLFDVQADDDHGRTCRLTRQEVPISW